MAFERSAIAGAILGLLVGASTPLVREALNAEPPERTVNAGDPVDDLPFDLPASASDWPSDEPIRDPNDGGCRGVDFGPSMCTFKYCDPDWDLPDECRAGWFGTPHEARAFGFKHAGVDGGWVWPARSDARVTFADDVALLERMASLLSGQVLTAGQVVDGPEAMRRMVRRLERTMGPIEAAKLARLRDGGIESP